MDVDVFRVLADPVRLRIVESLTGHERAVGSIVDLVDIRQSGVSRHLRILQEAGFVQSRADGTRRLYSLRADRFRDLDRWVEQYRTLWEARLDRFGAALETTTTAHSSKEKS
jgi:DNA-binding transcriptional ArsR family regulator